MYAAPTLVDDEGTYTAQAWAIEHWHTLAHYTYWYDHPPVGWVQIAGWTWLTGAFERNGLSAMAGREAMAVAKVVSLGLVFLLARRVGMNRVFAAVAVVLFGLSPLAMEFSRSVYLDNVAVPWLLAAFVVATLAAAEPGRGGRERGVLRRRRDEQGDDARPAARAGPGAVAERRPAHPATHALGRGDAVRRRRRAVPAVRPAAGRAVRGRGPRQPAVGGEVAAVLPPVERQRPRPVEPGAQRGRHLAALRLGPHGRVGADPARRPRGPPPPTDRGRPRRCSW